ncbi:hypothetical protein H6F32_03030 [Anabaena sp. FACHB-1237]|uniref:hypothetical protein n=1 Tax=Anabaena sp. FACHB-1237 TaxID=2692769 RepID=UPI001680DA5C|nr:hypothetical protein [Anabaena sp. FACHB-1237]MBD2136582.1 hypothetical protein [Anabaena sp. FACHB-1237]
MSYTSFWKTVPGMLTQPTGMAALASLGIHGAIALIVPLMPVNSSSSSANNTAKTVGLMELNQADESRLPQTIDNSQIALQNQLPLQQPQLPLQQQIPGLSPNSYNTVYPPTDPKFVAELNNQPSLPVIPTSPTNHNLPALPQKQSLGNLNTSNLNYTNLDQQISNLKTKSNTSSLSSNLPREIQTQISQNQYVPINRLPQVSSNTEIPAEIMKNPTPEAIDTQSPTVTAEKVALTNSYQGSGSGNGQKLAQSSEKVPSENQQYSQQAKVNNVDDAKAKINDKLLANLKSFNSLREDVKQQFPDVKEKRVIRETIGTNTGDMEGLVLGRLVVDADGKIVDIKFQEGSGSPQLQAKARDFFKANPPQADQQVVSSYPFQLQFRNKSNNIGEILKTKPAVSVPIEQKVSTPQNTPQETITPAEKTKVEENTLSVNSPQPIPTDSSTVESNNSSGKVASFESNNTSNKSSEQLLEKLRKIKQERQNN